MTFAEILHELTYLIVKSVILESNDICLLQFDLIKQQFIPLLLRVNRGIGCLLNQIFRLLS